MKSYLILVATVFVTISRSKSASAQAPQSFPSAADLVVRINANVGSGSTTSTLTYNYTVANSSTSRQPLAQWAIRYDPNVKLTITGTPPGWMKNQEPIGKQPLATWTGIQSVLSSGLTESGFVIEAEGLPGIVRALAMGDIPVDQLPQFPEGQAPESLPGSSILENSAQTQTVGPTAVPPTFDPLAFVGEIIALKEQAASLGWIGNRGIANSLDSKLNAAQASLGRGDNGTAKNQLNALLNEVEAQSGKALCPEAVALLKFNTQYLINRLP